MNRPLYGLLLLVTVLATVGGILTLVPNQGASFPNIFGYRSLCTFAPAASLFCFLIAGTTCLVRSTFAKRVKPRLREHSHAFIALGAVLVLALVSTFMYVDEKASYNDAGSGATTLVE